MGSSCFYCMCWRRRRVGTCNLIRVHLVLWLTSNKGICRGNSGVRGQCHAKQLGLVKPVKFAKYDNFLFDLLTKKQRSHIPPSSFVDGNYSTINNDVFYAIWATPLHYPPANLMTISTDPHASKVLFFHRRQSLGEHRA
jgi:hypothetical protein